MKYLQRKRIGFLIILLSLLFIVFIFFIPSQMALVFYVENTKDIHAYLPIDEEDHFQIIFKHSIHLSDVVEKYQVLNNHEILQYEIIYEQLGIGMPSNAEEGSKFVYEDGKYHIKDLENTFSSMNIRNGKTVSENRLIWGAYGEKMIWFNEYFTPGAWYKVKVVTLTPWQSWKGMKIDE